MQKILETMKIIPTYQWLLIIFLSLFVFFYPETDLYISSLFYDKNDGFVSNKEIIVYILYNSIKYILIVFYLFLLGLYFFNKKSKRNILNFNGKKLSYLFLVLIVGSGIVVNLTLKENWGRARPYNIEQFGGEKKFTPAFVMSDQKGHSFSSGHASAAFVFIAFAMLAERKRKFWMTLALIYGVSVGLVRIVVGGHFFSDTIVSFFIMYITSMLLYAIFFRNDKNISQKKL